MCRLLVDAMVWNYVAKARALDGFLRSLGQAPVTLTLVLRQVEKAVDSWPELADVLAAADDALIETAEPTDEEQELLSSLLDQRPGLGTVDCGLLAVAKMRGWSLATCDDRLAKTSGALGVTVVAIDCLLEQARSSGLLSDGDCSWVNYYRNGGTQPRQAPGK